MHVKYEVSFFYGSKVVFARVTDRPDKIYMPLNSIPGAYKLSKTREKMDVRSSKRKMTRSDSVV